jgi:tannase
MDYDMLFNFAYRSIHEMSVVGKALTQRFYQSSSLYSYYTGCSEGGREGMSQIQRYGTQFDGAAIGAPAFRQAFQQAFHIFSGLVETIDGYAPPPCELDRINNDTIAACDELDGRRDGVVSRSDLCKLQYNATESIGHSFSCSASGGSPFGGGATPAINGTVTAAGARVANDIWKGPFDSHGRRIYVSFQPAASFVDAATTYDNSTDTYEIVPNSLAVEYINYFLKEIDSTQYSYDNVTYDTLRGYILWGMQKFADTLQTTWPDLEDFHEAGGKVIHFHGESDNSIPTAASTIYHDAVRKIMYPELELQDGYDTLHDWYRLFLVPGAGHCGYNSEQPNGPFPTNVLQSVIDWVEKGVNPERLNATVSSSGTVADKDQEICSFPLRPVWKDGEMDCVFDQKSFDTWVPPLDSIPLPVY